MITIGVSLKMYFGYAQTLEWCRRVREIAVGREMGVELFVLPSFPAIAPVVDIFLGTSVAVGAQDLHTADAGPYTGEVSGAFLAEMGCAFVEVGHAERRRLFGEDDEVAATKAAAAMRNGLTPVLCLGEPERMDSDQAAAACVAQLGAVLQRARGLGVGGRVVVAYEPYWAIGASEPAPVDHSARVCAALWHALDEDTLVPGSAVIYGGSAGPGLLTELDGAVSGLFLGRFAHDPAALKAILDEAGACNLRSDRHKT